MTINEYEKKKKAAVCAITAYLTLKENRNSEWNIYSKTAIMDKRQISKSRTYNRGLS